MKKLENRGLFKVEGIERNFTAFSDQNETSGGWAVPYFEKEEALEILNCIDARFLECKTLDDGTEVIVYLDDDCKLEIIEPIKFDCFGEEKILFPVGKGLWTWEGVNCDPQRPGLEEKEEMLVEALVEKDDQFRDAFNVVLHKNGIDADWWGVHVGTEEQCKEIASQINQAFKRFGLTK